MCWAASCFSLLPFYDSPPWGWSGDWRRVVLPWHFQKLLVGFRLCVVHHLLFDYKGPRFSLWKKLVLAFCSLLLACSWAQRRASKMSLKSHLNHLGLLGRVEQQWEGRAVALVMCWWAWPASWISVKVHSLPVAKAERVWDSRTGRML